MITILVPTDFTEAARNASIYAAKFANSMQCKILLYHAWHLPVVPTADAPVTVMVDNVAMESENLNLLRKEAAYLKSVSDVQIDCITTEGFAVDEIIAIEKKEKPDLIIMGLTAAGAFTEYLLGSLATDVIGKSQTPVLIVPDKIEYKNIDKIAFASDYVIEPDTDELFTLKHIIKMFKSKLYILNVEKEKEDIEVDKAIQMMKIENYFDDIEHTHHLPIDNDTIHGLNTFIAENEIDMIAMIPHKHKLLSHLFKESTTKKMAFHTTIPLLVLHTPHKGEE